MDPRDAEALAATERDLGYKVDPCIGCGWCCRKNPCPLAFKLHGDGITRCPDLEYNDGVWRCGAVMRAEGPLEDQYREILHIGAGCCANINSDRQKIPTPAQVGWGDEHKVSDQTDWKVAFQALAMSVGDQFVRPEFITLVSKSLQQHSGEAISKEFDQCVCANRSPFVTELMGDKERA